MKYLFFLLLLCTSKTCFAEPESDYPPDIKSIKQRGELIVALVDAQHPPFFYIDAKGNWAGYDIELAKDIARHLGVKVSYNRSARNMNEVIKIVAKHEADLGISLLTASLPRALYVNFTKPYIRLHLAFLVNRLKAAKLRIEADTLHLINDSRINIGVLSESTYMHFLQQEYDKVNIVPYHDMQHAMQDVKKGKLVAVFFDDLQIQNWLDRNVDANLYVDMIELKDDVEPIAIAVPWKDIHFLEWLNLYLETVKHNGYSEDLALKHFKVPHD